MAVLAGCGGAGGASGGTNNPPVDTAPEVGTAKFSVDVATGKVKVTPLNGDPTSRAIFAGTALAFTSGDLLVDAGEITRRKIAVEMENNTTETIGAPGKGFKVMFGDFKTLNSTATDLRPQTNVSTYAGSGSAGSQDGPLLGASITNPTSVLVDGAGSIYFSGFDERLRVARNGSVTTLITDTGAIREMIWENNDPATGIIYATSMNTHRILRIDLHDNTSSVIAGSGSESTADGPSTSASFEKPHGIAEIGNFSSPNPDLLVSQESGVLRRLTWDGSEYQVSTLGIPFTSPRGLIALGNDLFAVAETFACKISIFDLGGTKTQLGSGTSGSADGDGTTMQFYEPTGLHAYKDSIFISDTGGNIRQLTLDAGANIRNRASWHSATLAGPALGAGFADGSGVDAMFNSPFSLAVDYSGNILVADVGNNRIRQIIPTNGRFPFAIGSGASTGVDKVRLANPTDFVPGGANSDPTPYILENQTVDPLGIAELTSWDLIVPTGVKFFEFTVTIEAETDTIAPPDAVFNAGPGVGNGSARAIVRTLSGVTTAGYANGNVSSAAYATPTSFAYDAAGNLFVADADNRAIRRITPAGQVSTVAGGPTNAPSAGDGHGGVAGFGVVAGVAVNTDGTVVYVTDSTNNTVRRISLTGSDPAKAFDWTVTTIAGLAGPVGYAEGAGTVARFSKPWGIVLTTGGELVISEATGNRLRRLQPVGADQAQAANWVVSLVAGETTSASPNAGYQDGTGSAVRFTDPRGLALAASGEIYVAERGNHKIRSVNVAGTVKTFAGALPGGFGDNDYGSQAKFNAPMDVAVDRAGYVYVADTNNRVIRRISPNGAVRTIAGGNGGGTTDGPGNVARFNGLNGIEVSPAGDVVVGDAMRIRLIERLISSGIVG